MALVLAAASAHAQHGITPSPTAPNATPSAERVVQVYSTFTDLVTPQCEYTARVSGTVRVRGGDDLTSARYEPDLRITATLDCGVLRHAPIQSALQGVSLTREQLLDELEARARVISESDQMVCYFSPRFRLERQQLVGQSLVRWCESPPRSNGPRLAGRTR